MMMNGSEDVLIIIVGPEYPNHPGPIVGPRLEAIKWKCWIQWLKQNENNILDILLHQILIKDCCI